MRSIVIQSSNLAQAPKSIKLFVNRPSLGFDDVEDAQEPEAAQLLELTEEQVREGKPIQLRFVRFQAVNSLHVRIPCTRANDYSHNAHDLCIDLRGIKPRWRR